MEKVLENNHIDDSRREIWKFSEKSGRTATSVCDSPFARRCNASRRYRGSILDVARIEHPDLSRLCPSEVRARIIDGSRSKNGNLGLASGGIRHRIVGSLRKEHLK